MRGSVSARRQPRPVNTRRSEKQPKGICFTTDQQGEKGDWEGKWDRDEEQGKEAQSKLLKKTKKQERGEKRKGGGGLQNPVTLHSPGHAAPGLLYPPPAINHLILSLLNQQPAPPHPN